jgi:hypothetical protein
MHASPITFSNGEGPPTSNEYLTIRKKILIVLISRNAAAGGQDATASHMHGRFFIRLAFAIPAVFADTAYVSSQ